MGNKKRHIQEIGWSAQKYRLKYMCYMESSILPRDVVVWVGTSWHGQAYGSESSILPRLTQGRNSAAGVGSAKSRDIASNSNVIKRTGSGGSFI